MIFIVQLATKVASKAFLYRFCHLLVEADAPIPTDLTLFVSGCAPQAALRY